jgi:hypothetical protein
MRHDFHNVGVVVSSMTHRIQLLIASIFAKLKVENRAQAIVLARRAVFGRQVKWGEQDRRESGYGCVVSAYGYRPNADFQICRKRTFTSA